MEVTGPEPEQLEDGRVVQHYPGGKLAEFPGILVEGEIAPDKGVDANGELYCRGGWRKFCSLSVFWVRYSVTILSGQGARRRGEHSISRY